MYCEQNPLSAYSRNPNQLEITNRKKPQRSSSVPIKPLNSPPPGSVDLIIKLITYALLIAGVLALIALVGSNIFKGAHALSLDDNRWRSVEHNGIEISVEGLLKARRMLVEDPLMRDFSECKECVIYSDLKSYLDSSARAGENYVMIKVADATRIKVDGTEHAQLAAMENFVGKTSKIPWLKEKLEELLRLNKTFSTTLAGAIETEREVQGLRNRYEIKSRNIEDLSNKAKRNLQEASGFTAKIEAIKTKLNKAETSIIDNINGLKVERDLVEGRIEEMRDKIRELLKEARVASAPELADDIALKTSAIEAQKKVREICEKKIELHGEEITTLNIRRTEAHRSLGDIELQLSRWHWVKHVLETIKKFEDIREQVKQLQISQLADGKKNIDRLITSLTTKESQFAEDKRDMEEGRVSPVREEKKVTVDDSGNTITEVIQRTNSPVANLENQQDLIEKEQAYLKTWSREQFKTLNLSTHEIRNLTETIDNLSARIKNAGEYEKYTDLKALTEKEIEITIARLGELETELQACESLVGDNSKTIEQAQSDLKNLEKIRSDIRDLENRMSTEEIQLQEKDAALRKERQEISGKRKNAAEDIDQAEKRLRSLREALRGLVKSINDRIVDPPRMNEVKSNIEKYQARVKKSNEEFQKMLDLMEEIRKIIC